jgi:hypothetical protein
MSAPDIAEEKSQQSPRWQCSNLPRNKQTVDPRWVHEMEVGKTEISLFLS